MRIVIVVLLLAVASFSYAAAPAPAEPAPAVPAVVPQAAAPVAAITPPAEPTNTTNLAQWITLCAALLGAFIKRMNAKDVQTFSWATLRDVVVVGGATYATMDLAAELGFLQSYMAAITRKPLTLGVVSLLVSLLAGGGVVAAIEVILNQATGVLQKLGVKDS